MVIRLKFKILIAFFLYPSPYLQNFGPTSRYNLLQIQATTQATHPPTSHIEGLHIRNERP